MVSTNDEKILQPSHIAIPLSLAWVIICGLIAGVFSLGILYNKVDSLARTNAAMGDMQRTLAEIQHDVGVLKGALGIQGPSRAPVRRIPSVE